MPSPIHSLSAPLATTRSGVTLENVPSPELPSPSSLISRVPTRNPIRSGSKAQPIPVGASSTFTSAKDHWKSAQVPADNGDDSLASVVEVEPEPEKKQRKRRKPKDITKEADSGKKSGGKSGTDQPRSRAKSSSNANRTAKNERQGNPPRSMLDTQADSTKHEESKHSEKSTRRTDGDSAHTRDHQEESTRNKTKAESGELLHLEQAPMRRVDWTPPQQQKKFMVEIPSDGPTAQDVACTQGGEPGVFGKLLENYGCEEPVSRKPTAASDQDGTLFKKRKLIEPVTTIDPGRSAAPNSEESPAKPKATKKKPRTITELATAAYRPASQAEPSVPPHSVLNVPPGNPEGAGTTNGGAKRTNGPVKKVPARKSRKKPPPPKPILLSPTAALNQVSKQDFVFGTSSQLAREHSPSFLRDIQSAIRDSNAAGWDPYSGAPDSDAIEASEERKRLWNAGSRDIDGLLFDADIRNDDGAPQELPAPLDDNPFGYVKADDRRQAIVVNSDSPHMESFETLSDILPPQRRAKSKEPDELSPDEAAAPQKPTTAIPEGDDSFETLSDILPRTPRHGANSINGDAVFSSSPDSASTSICRLTGGNRTGEVWNNKSAALGDVPVLANATDPTHSTRSQSRPRYDLYTDAQLTKEITTFGFKPVKRRTAMLALLDQCWQSSHPPVAGARTVATSTKPAVSSDAASKPPSSPKRPRGRPRKNSSAIPQVQVPPPSAQAPESPRGTGGSQRADGAAAPSPVSSREIQPPPSAQPIEAPKRGRGRPRKDMGTCSTSSPTKPAAKRAKKTSKASSPLPPSTPKRRQATNTVVEIPDSASEAEADMVSSPASPIEPTFSPPPGVDLSVSLDEDTELSLSATPDDKQRDLHDRITEAITTAPRTTDPSEPSWYEKILLYDPIVLEDLTGWLNSGQLTRVGHDDEVRPAEVKKWCESKSVCCLWKVNLRGRERKRY